MDNIVLERSVGINVYSSDHTDKVMQVYSRKDFYKICLFFGEAIIEYADRGIKIEGITLFFGTSQLPYSWQNIAKEKSYACLFTEEFLKTNNNSESLQQSPLFKVEGTPVFHITKAHSRFLEETFKRMLAEYNTEYAFKNDLIRNYINLLIHEALKLQPSENFIKHKNASERISALFLELLERQFPIEIQNNHLQLKSANDYAKNLAVHINHLNRAVKSVTGKSTTTHIADRVLLEAKAMLKNTDWSVSEIAYALGYSEITHFNNFFKKHAKTSPMKYRNV